MWRSGESSWWLLLVATETSEQLDGKWFTTSAAVAVLKKQLIANKAAYKFFIVGGNMALELKQKLWNMIEMRSLMETNYYQTILGAEDASRTSGDHSCMLGRVQGWSFRSVSETRCGRRILRISTVAYVIIGLSLYSWVSPRTYSILKASSSFVQ